MFFFFFFSLSFLSSSYFARRNRRARGAPAGCPGGGAARSRRSLPENPGYENKLKAETKKRVSKLGAEIDTFSWKKKVASKKKAAERKGASAVGGKYDKVPRKNKDATYKSASDKKAAEHEGAAGSKKLQKPVLKSNYPDKAPPEKNRIVRKKPVPGFAKAFD